ncbi:2OG-Fe(II) oxygenase [Streptomyces sp. NPDC056519]|uniref:2OG-Fe(II) oxygenase n=1 Tax=Streptomyces sp. NPDC056519 TaxID=3345849 RepID=UPI0036828DF5
MNRFRPVHTFLLGTVQVPLRAPVTKKLIAQARQACFGRGEQTLSDTGIRDTWEITPDRITLGGTDWDRTLDGVLDGVRTALGLPPTTALRAEPHALLVYGKGQFFLPHQDSEKDDSMVGTLVVSLPSHHTGGELVVSHAGRSVVHQASREKLTFAAFYADCLHEVRPVTSGYRVTLTMNLLAERIRPAGEDDEGPVADLAHCLTAHFTGPAEERYADGRKRAAPPEPSRVPPRPRVHPARSGLGPPQGRRHHPHHPAPPGRRGGGLRSGRRAGRGEGDLGRLSPVRPLQR